MAVYTATLEELGAGDDVALDVTIEYEAHAGERRTYDYPGSAPYVEIVSVRCDYFFGSVREAEEITIARYERPDWFAVLDKIATAYVLENEDDFAEEILDELNQPYL